MPLPEPLRFSVSRSHGGPHPLDGAMQFADVLSARLGSPVELTVANSYDDLADGLIAGNVHLAWMPPLAHARATQKGAVLAVVAERGGALTYRSALLVRTDSVHTSTRGLRGVRAAWTDPSSASGYLYARLHLSAAGIDPRRDIASERFYGTPFAACSAVLNGDADLTACYVRDTAGSDPALAIADVERIMPRATERLRVLDVTDRIPPDGVVLSSRIEAGARIEITDVLLDLHNQDSGLAALEALMQAERLSLVTDEVLRIIARLRAHVHVS